MRFLLLFFSLVVKSKAVDNNAACGTPGRPFGGAVLPPSKNSFQNGDTVSYSCRWTDYLLGSVIRTCETSGKWTGFAPVCLSPSVFLGSLDNRDYFTGHPNQIITHQSHLFFDHNPVTCVKVFGNDGLRLSMKLNSTSHLEAVRLVFPTNSNNPKFVVDVDYSHRDSFICVESASGSLGQGIGFHETFDCSSTYGVAQTLNIVFRKTTYLLSICEIYLYYRPDDSRCDTPDAPLHGNIQQTRGKIFTFSCDLGYKLSGSKTATCANDRSWNEETPTCIEDEGFEDSQILNEQGKSQVTVIEWNWNYLYVGLVGLAVLIVLIVTVVLIVRCVIRWKTFEAPGRNDGRNMDIEPSNMNETCPFSSNSHPFQGTILRHWDAQRSSANPNHYSVAVIPGEDNYYATIMDDMLPMENISTAEHVYEDCFSGCSRDLYDDCFDSPQPFRQVPQPPQPLRQVPQPLQPLRQVQQPPERLPWLPQPPRMTVSHLATLKKNPKTTSS